MLSASPRASAPTRTQWPSAATAQEPTWRRWYPPSCINVRSASTRRRSHELFRSGYFLTARSIENFESLYIDSEHEADPRASVLLTEDLAGFPATYLSTAGFDPLRDEGEAFAARLADAGVSVELSRHPDLIHGYASLFPLGGRFLQATAEALGVTKKRS